MDFKNDYSKLHIKLIHGSKHTQANKAWQIFKKMVMGFFRSLQIQSCSNELFLLIEKKKFSHLLGMS